ncbi:MAG: RNA-binding protein [Candidatus Babeliaceae bacterium]|nr:RNA-binding protein [Candidatus Babeliaceae bacterium]
MNIYVGNLSRTVTEDALRKLFEAFGAVSSVKIMTDKFTGEPRGFAFLTMEDDEQAQQAINALDNSDLEGQRVRVNTARPPQPRTPGQGGFRSNGGGQGGYRSSGSQGGFGGSRERTPGSGFRSGSTGGFRGNKDRY